MAVLATRTVRLFAFFGKRCASASICSVQMRTTLNLDDTRIARATELTGLREKTALIHAGFDSLIARASAQFPTTRRAVAAGRGARADDSRCYVALDRPRPTA
jgi:hypothetical protein